MMNDSGKQEFS